MWTQIFFTNIVACCVLLLIIHFEQMPVPKREFARELFEKVLLGYFWVSLLSFPAWLIYLIWSVKL